MSRKSPFLWKLKFRNITVFLKHLLSVCLTSPSHLDHSFPYPFSSPLTFFHFLLAVGTKMPSKNFVFKCHRDGNNVHSVNSIDFHPYGSFCTAGSDGTFSWWDKEARYVCQYVRLILPSNLSVRADLMRWDMFITL